MRASAVFLVPFLFISSSVHAVVKGSDTAVSIEATPTFPVADGDNEMRGFGWFKNGFTLEDASTTCIFNSVYPVSGTVTCPGTLTLQTDLIFNNVTTLSNFKSVTGNAHTIQLCSSITSLPSDTTSFDDINLVLHEDVTINSVITFTGNCTIHGTGHTLILGVGGSIIVGASSTLSLEEICLEGASGTNISCADDTGTLILDSMCWMQSADATFASGKITINDEVHFSGPYKFSYTSSQISTINTGSCWRIGGDMTLEIGRKLATGYVEPLAFTDSTSVLKLDDCTWSITANGMGLTKGEALFDGDVTITVASTDTSNGLTLGDATAGGNFVFHFSPSATIRHTLGHISYNNTENNLLQSASKEVSLIRSENSFIHVAESLKLPAVTIKIESLSVPPMTMTAGRTLEYDGSFVVLPDVQFDISSNQLDATTYLLNGNDTVFFSKGELPLGLSIQGAGNKISGNGSVQGPVVLQDAAAELTCDITGELLSSPTMNGGELILSGDLKFGPGVVLSDAGDVNLSSYQLSLGAQDLTWPSAIGWTCNNSEIALNSTVALNAAWTINGTCTLNGNGNVLDLSGGGEIIVAAGATLMLKDVRLRGVSGTNIRCIAGDSTIKLRNVVWLQNGDATFSEGSFEFNDHVTFGGPHTFAYTSAETSTIKSKSVWCISDGMTLSIGRKLPLGLYYALIEPLEFEEETSVLGLDNCSLYITANGMQFTKGLIEFRRTVNIDMASVDFSTGVTVGDGVIANDLHIQFNAGATVRYNTGHFTLNNIATDTLKSAAHKNGLWLRSVGSYVLINQDLVMPEVSTEITSLLVSPMVLGAGKTLTYENTRVILPGMTFDIKGTQYDPFTYLLDGDDYLFFEKGTLPLSVIVQGTGNVFKGNGSMAGALSLQDSNAALTCSISGEVVNSVVMNGGTITLGGKLRMGTGAYFVGPGTVDVQGHSVSLGAADLTWATPHTWSGAGGVVHCNADIALNSSWTINGSVTIEGHGNTLDLTGGGDLIVAAGATLHLKNIEVRGISGTKIRCVDDTGTIVLDDVVWVQSADTTFAAGVLQFKNLTRFIGDGTTFAYQSDQVSSVGQRSTLKLYPGFTLSYEPVGGSKDLWLFDDETSWLVLDNATLHASATGLNLKKGKMKIKGNSTFSSDVVLVDDEVTTDEGITLGDGVGANDLCIEIVSGATLAIATGSLNYKNINVGAWTMHNINTVCCIAVDVDLHIYESLDFGVGSLHLLEGAILTIDDGKTLTGSVIHVI